MKRYYYVATALPTLKIGDPPEISFEELMVLLKENLNKKDFKKIEQLRLYYDIQNLKALWKKKPFNRFANFNSVQLEENLIDETHLPWYVFDFIEKYESIASRLSHFEELVSHYYLYEIQGAKGFLKKYLSFEKEWRLIFLGFRAKVLSFSLSHELQYQDPHEEIVAQMMAQKDSKSYIVPSEYESLQPLFEKYRESPMKMYQGLLEYRFNKIEELLGVDLFSLERIVGYVAQLILIENWEALDQEKGSKIIKSLM